MRLIPVNPQNETHVEALYALLAERTPEQSISHRGMPTKEAHIKFVERSVPHRLEEGEMLHIFSYEGWYLITDDRSLIVGSVYITRRGEIGVSVFEDHQEVGWGSAAVREVMRLHPAHHRYLANINPANEPSRKMFEKLGFKLVQHTYALEAE